MRAHPQGLCTYASCMRQHTWACVHMLGFQKLWNASFSTLKKMFGINPTSSRSCSKSPFFNYKRLYMIHFQNTQKILKENRRFTKNSESKREFFIKHHQVNIFLIEAFPSLDFRLLRLLITFLFDWWIDWLRGTVKIKLKSFVFWGISSSPIYFLFLYFNLLFLVLFML